MVHTASARVTFQHQFRAVFVFSVNIEQKLLIIHPFNRPYIVHGPVCRNTFQFNDLAITSKPSNSRVDWGAPSLVFMKLWVHAWPIFTRFRANANITQTHCSRCRRQPTILWKFMQPVQCVQCQTRRSANQPYGKSGGKTMEIGAKVGSAWSSSYENTLRMKFWTYRRHSEQYSEFSMHVHARMKQRWMSIMLKLINIERKTKVYL